MKVLLATLLISSSAFAQDLCTKWRSNERYERALNTLAQYLEYDPAVMCTLPGVLDIEVQPSRIIDQNGDVIPHVRIYFHKSYESCYYMVRDEDQEITSGRCFSTF